MSNTERLRVISLLAQSPAQETVGQTGLAGPLTSQQDYLPPEHAGQPLPLLHLSLTRWCLVDSVRTLQSVLPGLWCQTAATDGDSTGQSKE